VDDQPTPVAVVEPLPGYAPDLNPTEQVWGNLKSREQAHLCADSIDDVAVMAELGLDRIGTDDSRCLAFLSVSPLPTAGYFANLFKQGPVGASMSRYAVANVLEGRIASSRSAPRDRRGWTLLPTRRGGLCGMW
jgi:hypothetical protein